LKNRLIQGCIFLSIFVEAMHPFIFRKGIAGKHSMNQSGSRAPSWVLIGISEPFPFDALVEATTFFSYLQQIDGFHTFVLAQQ
jgi:hypothetical protein